jgi:lysyl-tRNA synthetase class 2
VNPKRLRQRAAITRAIRNWFEDNGYLEVHTPSLVVSPALEEHLEPVAVGDRFLHTSPEFGMKKVLSAGLCRIYQITPCFRAEEVGVHHTQEFTMIEWYRVGAGTAELMDDTEAVIVAAAQAVGTPLPPFERISVDELRSNENIPPTDDEIEWFRQWVACVEPTLESPTIVFNYPTWQSALATERNGYADRFEVYLGGIEIGNCFAEETNPSILRNRFQSSATKRQSMGKAPHPFDEDLLDSTKQLPRTSGIAIGLDRLVMALTGAKHIHDVQAR